MYSYIYLSIYLFMYLFIDTLSAASDLEDGGVVLDEVLDGAGSVHVLPVALEQRGAEDDGQVMEVHLVELREALHAEDDETHMSTFMKTWRHLRYLRYLNSPVEVVDEGLECRLVNTRKSVQQQLELGDLLALIPNICSKKRKREVMEKDGSTG